jgi:ferredoxin
MPGSLLKTLRRFVSVGFLLLISLSFLDFTGALKPIYFQRVTFLQFVPSMLKFMHFPVLVGVGFIIVIMLTIAFGRVYCSWLCPLGAFQDIFTFFSRKTSRKKRFFSFTKPLNYLRYPVLGIVSILLLSGITSGLVFADPFSVYGRMANHLFMPVALLLNNGISWLLAKADIFTLKPYPYQGFDLAATIIALVFGVVIGWLALKKGRLYCNAYCPVGSLLGLFSRLSVFRIYLDRTRCTHCGICAADCKSGCIDFRERVVDTSRCVGCFNCLTSCKDGGVKFDAGWKSNLLTDHKPTNGRRTALKALLIAPALLTMNALAQTKKIISNKALISNDRAHFSSPPGSVSIDRFNSVCTACHLCLSACPTRVLQPSLFEYGLKGMLQPYMDYKSNFCNFECTRCGDVCPTGAILPLFTDQKKRTQIGKARFVEKNCVVYTDGTACGACSEHCPTKAVNMAPYNKPGLLIPKVEEAICVGCGACEYACPTMPYKAIYVEGNAVHKKADKPKGSANSKEVVPEEFPF